MFTGRQSIYFIVTCIPSVVLAHSSSHRFEGFLTGLVHFLSSPAQVLLVLALAFLMGNFPVGSMRKHLSVFIICTFIGAIIGDIFTSGAACMVALAFISSAIAALFATKFSPLVFALAAIGGLFLGITSKPGDGPLTNYFLTLFGGLFGVNIALLYTYGILQYIKERIKTWWVEIGMRIAAAWIAAISLIYYALLLVSS